MTFFLHTCGMDYYPQRIVCLTEETTETLYLLGQQDRIVGISGFTVRPSQARKEKPKVSAFTEADIETIVKLEPDLVIGFSDIQADIAKKLIARGLTVWVNNHRSVAGILQMIVQLGALTGSTEKALQLAKRINKQIEEIKKEASVWPLRPKIYFEEWYEPLISGIRWVGEIISLAGGQEAFPQLSRQSLAKDRIIADPQEVVAANPDIILASWCGKKFKPARMLARPGWQDIKAVKEGYVYEIDSAIILQPGPAALLEGLPQIHSIVKQWIKDKL